MKQKTIDSCIVSVIEESVKATLQRRALQEKEKQAAAASKLNLDKKETSSSDELKKLRKSDVTVDDIVEKLNSIRSGKSFKDEIIFSSLKKYFEGLGSEEKVALLAFLKGISQIVTGEIGGAEAIEPSDKPADIEMKKTSGPQKVSLKPNIIKAPDIKKDKKPSSEDTSGPVPITPKMK